MKGSSSKLVEDFRAGRHHAVLSATIDAAEGSVCPEHTPWVVGSLAMLGRIDEALALAEAASASGADDSTAVPARFFAVVGLLHSGRWREARAWASRNASACRALDPTLRFYGFQGIALLRYFAGEIGPARRAARRALQEAVRAGFAYGRLLALDLGGHVLVQKGEISAGLRVLDQAERLATSMGADSHRAAIECAMLAYRNRHGRAGDDLETALSRVAASSVDNVYARRAAWLETAFRTAILGDALRARDALERAREQVLPDRDHRARARLLLVEAILARLDRSMHEVRAALAEAVRALERGDDRILRTEIFAWDRVLGASSVEVTLADARTLARTTGSLLARVLVALLGGPALTLAERAETPLWALLAGADPPTTRAETAVARGWLGLVPLLLTPGPGRWIVLLGNAIVCADRGVVSPPAQLAGHGRPILEALAAGSRTKESLIRDVWRVPKYAAHLHDPVVHTAIARLRRAMGDAAQWIETGSGTYALRGDVGILDVSRTPRDEGAPSGSYAPDSQRGAVAGAEPQDDLRSAVLAAIGSRPQSVRDLAERLGTSESTVLRRLRELIARGEVAREGSGKNTRYALVSERPR